jgi:hypothetical protein
MACEPGCIGLSAGMRFLCDCHRFRGSSTVEQAAVNRKAGGSNPPPGAIQTCCGLVDAKTILAERLRELWERHDKLEREIIALERRFTDEELEALHSDG